MQYKVPQNIDKADQIVGPLTLVEFSYLAVGGALDILINQTISNGPLKYFLMLIISLVALAFTFLKVQDRPLLFFITASIQYALTPKTRVWHKVSNLPIVKPHAEAEKKVAPLAKKSLDQEKLMQVAAAVDTHGRGQAAPKQVFSNIKSEEPK